MFDKNQTVETLHRIYTLKIENESEDAMWQYIASLNRKSLILGLEELISSGDNMRYAASRLYCRLDQDSAINFLLPFLENSDRTFIWHLCRLMGSYGNDLCVKPLAEKLINEQDEGIRYEAAVSLIAIGDERALPALEHAAQYDKGTDFEGRRIDAAAREAIAKIKSQKV